MLRSVYLITFVVVFLCGNNDVMANDEEDELLTGWYLKEYYEIVHGARPL